jgi:hypothetical protein
VTDRLKNSFQTAPKSLGENHNHGGNQQPTNPALG